MMAVADISKMGFGLLIGGTDKDETTAFTDVRQVKALYFFGNADAASCVITSKNGSGAWVTSHEFSLGAANDRGMVTAWFGEIGSTFHGMKVTNSNNDDLLAIHFV